MLRVKLLCTSCHLLREAEDKTRPFVCSSCKAKATPSPAVVHSIADEVTSDVPSSDLLPVSSAKLVIPAPPPSTEGEPVSMSEVELLPESVRLPSSATAESDPVSLRDLQAVLSPGQSPPRWARDEDLPAPTPNPKRAANKSVAPAKKTAAKDATTTPTPIATAATAAETKDKTPTPSPAAASVKTPSPSPSEATPLFGAPPSSTRDPRAARVRPPAKDLFDAPLPPVEEPESPIELGEDDEIIDPDQPRSGLVDILQMAQALNMPTAARMGSQPNIDEDLVNLSGSLFAGTASNPFINTGSDNGPVFSGASANAPLIAPVMQLTPPDTGALTKPTAAKASAPARAPASGRPSAPATSRSEPPPRVAPIADAPSKPSSTRTLLLAGVAIAAGALGFFLRGATPPTPVTTAESAKAPTATVATAATAAPPSSAAKIPEPSVDDPVKPTASAVAAIATAAPKLTGQLPVANAPPSTAAVKAPPSETAVAALPKTSDIPPPPPPPPAGADFDKGAAKAALAVAAGRAAGCRKDGDPNGIAKVSVTFSPSGRVTGPRVDGPPFQGTPTGGCIAQAFRGVSVPPFEGSPVTVSYSVTVK
jgi:hypothetical protein